MKTLVTKVVHQVEKVVVGKLQKKPFVNLTI